MIRSERSEIVGWLSEAITSLEEALLRIRVAEYQLPDMQAAESALDRVTQAIALAEDAETDIEEGISCR